MLKRMDHVGVVVDDLAAATAFFAAIGFDVKGETTAEGRWVDRVVGLEGVRTEVAFVATPDGRAQLELIKFRHPPGPAADTRGAANVPGLRHLAFVVDDLNAVVERLRAHGAALVGEIEQYENIFLLCYVRGPAGIIVELAEEIGG